MAAYKAEATYQRYRRRLRPALALRAGLAAALGPAGHPRGWLTRLANASLRVRALHPLVTWPPGWTAAAACRTFAPQTFRRWFDHRADAIPARRPRVEVVLFVDTFTDAFSPEVGQAAVAVLEDAGYRVQRDAASRSAAG